jgi:hypothetical protein
LGDNASGQASVDRVPSSWVEESSIGDGPYRIVISGALSLRPWRVLSGRGWRRVAANIPSSREQPIMGGLSG